jgi:hypothetical protein
LCEAGAAFEEASGVVTVRLRVNGRLHTLAIDPRTSLLDLLREQLALTGAKKGCDHGQCGAWVAGEKQVVALRRRCRKSQLDPVSKPISSAGIILEGNHLQLANVSKCPSCSQSGWQSSRWPEIFTLDIERSWRTVAVSRMPPFSRPD